MKSKSYPILFGLVAALLVQAGSAGLQPALQAAGNLTPFF